LMHDRQGRWLVGELRKGSRVEELDRLGLDLGSDLGRDIGVE
jgi:hypothetical protein